MTDLVVLLVQLTIYILLKHQLVVLVLDVILIILQAVHHVLVSPPLILLDWHVIYVV
jgi:hypothetical protein